MEIINKNSSAYLKGRFGLLDIGGMRFQALLPNTGSISGWAAMMRSQRSLMSLSPGLPVTSNSCVGSYRRRPVAFRTKRGLVKVT
jgi:hypothetical protein